MDKTRKNSYKLEVDYADFDALNKAAYEALDFAGDIPVWLFHGDLGAGKTTFIKCLGQALGVEELINSPSFALINHYQTPSEKNVYHFDFYRIEDPEEASEIGAEEYFDSGDYCFIEWPTRVHALLPGLFVDVYIEIDEKKNRIIQIQRNEQDI